MILEPLCLEWIKVGEQNKKQVLLLVYSYDLFFVFIHSSGSVRVQLVVLGAIVAVIDYTHI